jgi:hypothetical protein
LKKNNKKVKLKIKEGLVRKKLNKQKMIKIIKIHQSTKYFFE